MATRVIGPYFFENEDETPKSISGASYKTRIETFCGQWRSSVLVCGFNKMEQLRILQGKTMDLLNVWFPKIQIFLATSFARYFTAPDFFLWGHLKQKVYLNKPETIRQLKQNIRDEILEPSTRNIMWCNGKRVKKSQSLYREKWWTFVWCNISYIISIKYIQCIAKVICV